jgi:hypothetical protein
VWCCSFTPSNQWPTWWLARPSSQTVASTRRHWEGCTASRTPSHRPRWSDILWGMPTSTPTARTAICLLRLQCTILTGSGQSVGMSGQFVGLRPSCPLEQLFAWVCGSPRCAFSHEQGVGSLVCGCPSNGNWYIEAPLFFRGFSSYCSAQAPVAAFHVWFGTRAEKRAL